MTECKKCEKTEGKFFEISHGEINDYDGAVEIPVATLCNSGTYCEACYNTIKEQL